MAEAVVLRDVSKRYGRTTALSGLTVSFPAGALSGFLGPNGAGKTTTFRAILGLTRPDEGTIEVLGMRVGPDTARIVPQVGAIVEEPGLHAALSGLDNLRVAAHTLGSGHERIEELVDMVGLAGDIGRKVSGYSKGMRQRLAFAVALLGDPDLLLLDEPLDGLDPAGQATFRDWLRRLVARDGKTVVVSSHVLADIEQLADHVAVIDHGRLVVAGPLGDVLRRKGELRVEVDDEERALGVLAAAGLSARRRDGGIVAETDDGAAVSRLLAGEGLYPSALVPLRSSLEEVFLDLTAGGER